MTGQWWYTPSIPLQGEADGYLLVQNQTELYSEFQASQDGTTVRLYLKN